MIIGIIGAMEEEIEKFREAMFAESEQVLAGITFYTGKMEGKEIVLCKCGVGKVNAAICTQILVDRFKISHIIFTGVAGALHPELEIGDIVVSTDCQHHDIDVTALGFEKGVIPYANESIFKADDTLVSLAVNAGTKLNECRMMTGRILSGDQFVADRNDVKQMYEQFNGACTEMEGAAVAQTCTLNGIPFVIIRSMSDKADGSAHVNFPAFTKLASERSNFIVHEMLKSL